MELHRERLPEPSPSEEISSGMNALVAKFGFKEVIDGLPEGLAESLAQARAEIVEEQDEETRRTMFSEYTRTLDVLVDDMEDTADQHQRMQLGNSVHVALLRYELGWLGECERALQAASEYAYQARLDEDRDLDVDGNDVVYQLDYLEWLVRTESENQASTDT